MNRIDASNCPTYRVICGGNSGNVFLYENKFLTVRHVVADAIQLDGIDNSVDIRVCCNGQEIYCQILPPRHQKTSEVTVIALVPKEEYDLSSLPTAPKIYLFEESTDIYHKEVRAIGYIGNRKNSRFIHPFERRDISVVSPKEEVRNYDFNPAGERISSFKSLSGSPIFIDNGLFGMVNYQSETDGVAERLAGFCHREFFEELEVEYGITFCSFGGRSYTFELPVTAEQTELEAADNNQVISDLPELSFPDRMAQDCFDSYGDKYLHYWYEYHQKCSNILYFNRLMDKAARTKGDPTECINDAIRYLLDEAFLSDKVGGVERSERASWILGDKYWDLYARAENLEQHLALKRILQVVPNDLPDNPQRSLLLGIIACMEMEFEEAEEALVAAEAQCVGVWEKSNCHAEVHSFLGCVSLNSDGPGENAAAHFVEAKKYFRDQLRQAEQYRRIALRLMNVGSFVDAIEMLNQAVAIDKKEPVNLAGLIVSYERILEVCFSGFLRASDGLQSGHAIQRYKQEVIDTFDELRRYYPIAYPSVDSEIKIKEWAGKLFGVYAMALCQKNLSCHTLPVLIEFGTQLHIGRDAILDIMFGQTGVRSIQRLGLSHMVEEQQQLVFKCILSALIEGTVEELESDNIDALITAMLNLLFALRSAPAWTERMLSTHLCQTLGIEDKGNIRFGIHNSTSNNTTMYVEMSRSDSVEPFLSECVLGDVSQLVTITYITAENDNLFDELWRMIRKKLFRTVLNDFVGSKPEVASVYRFCDSQIRVCPCTYKHKDGKLIHTMHFFCHIR